jgi:hypothetical protein
MTLVEEDISRIKLDPKSRDDIPQLLAGLQYIYTNPDLRQSVFTILEEVVPGRVGPGKDGPASTDKGRPGMSQWRILVLGTLRLGLNADYDRIHELANQHRTLRQMLGHGLMDDEAEYHMQTLKDNLRLFTPEILDRINQEVVRTGHRLLKKTPTISAADVTPLWSRRMSTSPRTSICCSTRSGKQSKNARDCARNKTSRTGGKAVTISRRSRGDTA